MVADATWRATADWPSDQGCTYASEDYQDLLEALGLACSMSRRGNCWDSAVMESFFSTVTSELGERTAGDAGSQACAAVGGWCHHESAG